MKLLDKYLFRQLMGPLIYCCATFSMLYVISDLFGHLSKFIEAQTPVPLILQYYACVLVPSLEYILPAAMLLATLYTLWHLTRHNELTAMRSSGISFYRITVPFLSVGLALSVTTAAVKEGVAPEANEWAREFSDNKLRPIDRVISRDLAYYNSGNRRFWLIEEIDLKRPNRVLNIEITQEREDGSRQETLYAEKAEWMDGEWWFYNPQSQKYDAANNPLGVPKPIEPGSDVVINMPDLTEQPDDFLNEIKPWEFLSSLQMLRYLVAHPGLSERSMAAKRFDVQSRLAMPWACLVVTLFAIPSGVRHGRQSAITGIFLAVGCFFSYYALMQVGIFLAKRQLVWPWAGAWLANIVFSFAGLLMVRKVR